MAFETSTVFRREICHPRENQSQDAASPGILVLNQMEWNGRNRNNKSTVHISRTEKLTYPNNQEKVNELVKKTSIIGH